MSHFVTASSLGRGDTIGPPYLCGLSQLHATILSRRSCRSTSSGNHRCRDGGIPGPHGSSLHLHGGRSACSYSSRRSRVSKWRPSRRYSYRGSRCSVILVFSGIGASAVHRRQSRYLKSASGASRVGLSLLFGSLRSRSLLWGLCTSPSLRRLRGGGRQRVVAATSRPRLWCGSCPHTGSVSRYSHRV